MKMEKEEGLAFLVMVTKTGQCLSYNKVEYTVPGGYVIRPLRHEIGDLYQVTNDKGIVCKIIARDGAVVFEDYSDDLHDFITMVHISA